MEILRKYGVETDIYFPLIDAGTNDFAQTGDYTFASGDAKIIKDGGAAANTTNNPSVIAMGEAAMWKLTLTATEMQAAIVCVTISDAATKAVEDQAIIIATYGNASAEHAIDLDDSVRAGLTALPNAAADAAGGLPISDAGGLDMDNMVGNLLTTQMTEAYAADGVAPTLAQALFAIMQQGGEFAISGTTITVKKLDGSTAAMTFTLDDDTNPTSRTRAS